MLADVDIWRVAALMLDQHGDAAARTAAEWADAQLEKGDLRGNAIWLRVLRAIREIQRAAPHQGEAVN